MDPSTLCFHAISNKTSLQDSLARERFVEPIQAAAKTAAIYDVNLALETGLPPADYVALLDRINSPHITVNYDIGNSASLGFDVLEEIQVYGDKITDVHVKDRLVGGGPVMLGKGAADVDATLMALRNINYKGLFILQTYRDEDGLEICKQQLAWFREKLDRFFYCSVVQDKV